MSKTIKGARLILEVDDNNTLKVIGQEAETAAKSVGKVGKSAGDTRRNMQAMSGRVESGTKGFARMQQGTGGLVQSYAILASTLFAVGAAFRAMENAANIENQMKGFRSLAQITGTSMLAITSSVRAATGGMLDFQTAAQQTAIATAAGFTKTQITELAEGAKLASITLGRDLTDSFNRLIRGVTKAEPELLDELGIILRLDIATRNFAAANGLVAEKLTIAERRMAVFEEVQRQLINNFGAMEGEAEKFLNPFSKLSVAINDLVISLQKLPLGAFTSLVEFLNRNIYALTTVVVMFAGSILKQIVPSLTSMSASFEQLKTSANTQTQNLRANIDAQRAKIKQIEREFVAGEVKKNKVFKMELKRRGITQKKFNAMTLKQQKALVSKMIADEKAGATHTGKTNKQRLASYQALFKRIELASAKAQKTVGAHAKIMGAQIMMGVRQPAILTQKAIAGIGTAATAAAPKVALLGAAFSALLGIAMAFFTLKFILDFSPGIQRTNDALDRMKGGLDASREMMKELAFSFDERLLNEKIENVRTSFFKSDGSPDTIQGALAAANVELEYFGKLLQNLELGLNEREFEKAVSKLVDDTIRGMGDSGLISVMGGAMNMAGAAGPGGAPMSVEEMLGNTPFDMRSASLKAATGKAANTLLEGVAMAFKVGDVDKGKAMISMAFGDAMAESVAEGFKEAGDSPRLLAGLMEDLEHKLGVNALDIFTFDFETNEITGVTETFKAAMKLSNDFLVTLGDVPGKIMGSRAAAKSLAESFNLAIPKPSTIEKTANQIETLYNEFVDGKGKLKKLDSEELKLRGSIVQVLKDELGLVYESEEAAAAALKTEQARLEAIDFRMQTLKTIQQLSKAEMNNLKFLNTRVAKRFQIEQKIFDLRLQMVNNLDKAQKDQSNLVNYAQDQKDNFTAITDAAIATNQELQTQIDLLEMGLDRADALLKSLLETFDSSAATNLAKLFDTADLSEFGGKEMITELAKDLKKVAAKSLAEGLVDQVTGALTPERFKLNKKLDPAQKILAAHKQHIEGLANILNQHAVAMGAATGVKTDGITMDDPSNMVYKQLFGGGGDDAVEGGLRATLEKKLGPIGKFLFGSNNFGNQAMGITPGGGPEGSDDVIAYGQKNDPGFFGTSGGTDLFNIKAAFNDIFGPEGAFMQTGKNLFGGKESVFGKLGNSLFGEGGALSKMFGGGEGGFMGGLGQMFGGMGKAGGGMLSGLFGGGGGGGGLMALLKPLLSMIPGIGPLLSILPFAKGGIIGNKVQALAKGGVMERYAKGGIATQPTYLVGEGKQNEAVVPLPDNKSIPVDLGRGAGNENNVSISVNMADGSTNTKADAQQGKQLGAAINAAVLRELERQQRPGGMLQTQG